MNEVIKAAMQAAKIMLGYEAPVSSALMMPAERWECVKTAIECGILSEEGTAITAIERDRNTYARMVSALKHLGIRATCRLIDLDQLPCPKTGFDFNFLDLRAFIDQSTAGWVHNQLAPTLRDGAVVMFAMACDEKGEFPKAARAYFAAEKPDILYKLERERYHDHLRSLDAESALCVAVAQALLAKAGNVNMPIVMLPRQDGDSRVIVIVYRVDTSSKGDVSIVPGILKSLGDPVVEARPVLKQAHSNMVRRLDELQCVRKFYMSEIAQVDAELGEVIRKLCEVAN
ncbi:hypothetical protein [Propionivibrio sp.]|uniref:hypothetical protein n=1 Tax=Propionivibrio sp. TaxID=2212460 RepID=UPI003BF36EBB